jgi:hypothetical protein
MNNPELQKALSDVSQLSQGTAGLAEIAEKLPDQIATEREATIKQLAGEISAARKAAMADFLAEFKRIEERLIPEIARSHHAPGHCSDSNMAGRLCHRPADNSVFFKEDESVRQIDPSLQSFYIHFT